MRQPPRLWYHNMPASRVKEATPDDNNDIDRNWVAMRVLADGDLQVWAYGDDEGLDVTFPVVRGETIAIQPRRIMSGTTASILLLGY